MENKFTDLSVQYVEREVQKYVPRCPFWLLEASAAEYSWRTPKGKLRLEISLK